MHAFLARVVSERAAVPLTALWYVVLVVLIVYFALLDQAPFRYGQL